MDRIRHRHRLVALTLAVLEAKNIPRYVPPGARPDLSGLPAAVAGYWREARQAQMERGELP